LIFQRAQPGTQRLHLVLVLGRGLFGHAAHRQRAEHARGYDVSSTNHSLPLFACRPEGLMA
jgi:hypothetical protein